MGRELKRVPLDFKWPLGQIWKGYLNPYRSFECKACDGYGLNPETNKIRDGWYAFENPEYIELPNGRCYNNAAWSNHITDVEVAALMKAGRIRDVSGVNCRFDEEKGIWMEWTKDGEIECDKPEYPSAQSVNEWNRGPGFGHDAINQSICVRARAQHLGVYGYCEICDGQGHIFQSEEIRRLNQEWEPFEPPIGDGYQMWETTSEGSPKSPIFETLDELCQWLEDTNASVFGSSTAKKEQWMSMFDDNFVYHQDGNNIFI